MLRKKLSSQNGCVVWCGVGNLKQNSRTLIFSVQKHTLSLSKSTQMCQQMSYSTTAKCQSHGLLLGLHPFFPSRMHTGHQKSQFGDCATPHSSKAESLRDGAVQVLSAVLLYQRLELLEGSRYEVNLKMVSSKFLVWNLDITSCADSHKGPLF